MTWISSLSELYNYAIESDMDQGETRLIPIANLTLNAQIEIVINTKGQFLRGSAVPKDEAQTVVPCTIKSSSRTRRPWPHLIFDTLSYIGGDLRNYLIDKGKGGKTYEENFSPYIEQLKEWVNSANNHRYVEWIYSYINKQILVTDLIKVGILEVDENNKLTNKKIEGIAPEKALVRVAIEHEGKIIKPWEEVDFQLAASKHYLDVLEAEEKGLCYVSGEMSYISPTHGKYIRYAGDNAKLLSSNDGRNFTFRGRFNLPNEAAQIGYEVSEKAHSALRWIIRKQAYKNDGYIVVSWSNKDSDIPNVIADSDSFLDEIESMSDEISKDKLDTGELYAKELKKAISGYKSRLSRDEKIYIMALNSATPGRLSILYYRELDAEEYVDRLEKWYRDISWKHNYKKDKDTKKLYSFYGAASPTEIITAAFGIQRGEFMNLDNKIINKELERLIPCIIDGRRLQYDFVISAFRNACDPISKNMYNWNKCLTISCGLSKKYYKDRRGEEWDMKLNEDITDRSYLFGRLLAVAYRIEETYYYQNDISRTPSALRLMETLSKRPYKTWVNLQLKLIPYLQGFKTTTRTFYMNLLDDIMVKFEEGDYIKNRPLDPKFLMGFHSQREDLRRSKKETANNKKTRLKININEEELE